MKSLVNTILLKLGYRIEKVIPIVKPSPPLFKASYSQCGEDILIEYLFNLRGISLPSYIDIGANHPIAINNTYKFYAKGCRGLNIEPNKELASEFFKERPEDNTLSIGISSSEGYFSFYLFKDHTLNTFDKDDAANYIKAGHEFIKEEKTETSTIFNVLKKYHNDVFPDLLSIDVEGLDFEIIKSIEFERSYPKVMCVETAEYSPIGAGKKRTELMNYIIDKGYSLYADTNLNSIFVKNEFWLMNS